ncbi:MAG: branched-chain amino acid ABC transporter permease [Rhizobiales bacterium]|jgi:branched-chain amino acid transport system permease protein|nr:branched-chain amino acid ABC transporter permease [Hyphomicrobiales bacterium]
MTQALINGLVLGANYALMALGLTLIFALMGVLNFAHGQLYVLGGFVTYYVFTVMGLPFVVAVLASIVVLAIVGFLFDALFFRRVQQRSAREESSMLLAAGLALLLESLILLGFGEKQRGVALSVSGVYQIFDAYVPASRVVVFVVAMLAVVLFILFMRHTKPGRVLRAIAQDRDVTALQGVNIALYSGVGFAIGSALAGLAGSLLVTIFAVNSGMGTAISIKAFIMVMLGGAGIVSGAIVGAFVLGMVEALGYAFLPGSVTYLVIFVGLILFLVIRPNGIMGKPWG